MGIFINLYLAPERIEPAAWSATSQTVRTAMAVRYCWTNWSMNNGSQNTRRRP
jgi:hypothetical protein